MGKIILGFICILTVILSSCEGRCIEGSGIIISESRPVTSDFTGVELYGSFEVIVRHDSVASITVEGDDNILPYILTRVSGGNLVIESDKNCFKKNRVVIINVTMPFIEKVYNDGSGLVDVDTMDANLAEVELNGSGKIIIDEIYANDCHVLLDGSGLIEINQLTADDLSVINDASGEIYIYDAYAGNSMDISLTGSGLLTIDLVETDVLNSLNSGTGDMELFKILAFDVYCTNSGSGYVTLTGDVDYAEFVIKGSGNIDAFGLIQSECVVDIVSSGALYTFVKSYLEVYISGSGLVYFKGNPQIVLIGTTPGSQVVPA